MLLALAVLAGCAVGPDYKRPVVDSPGRFRDDNAATNRSFADLNWWNVYRDDTLQTLVREAFTNNYDLRIALTRVEQARQVAAQARSQFVPNVDYNDEVIQYFQRQLSGSQFRMDSFHAYTGKASPNIGFPLLDCSFVASS